ncbi:MAG: glycosyltransferase family A protein [Psychromonas sp.]
MNILVAILTQGVRDDTFEQCLQSVIYQQVPQNSKLALLVVENNPESLSKIKNVIKKNNDLNDINIYHSLETVPGIPFARNNALNYAKNNGYSHLAFIDDDAFAQKNWLIELSKDYDKFDVSGGPQNALFPNDTKSFYRLAKIYRERNLKDNASIKWAATNNILMSVATLEKLNLKFNESLIHGGEDKELFLRVSALGGKIHWRANAIVQESIVESRLSIKWALRRTFRMGATGYLIESCTRSTPEVLAICIFKGSAYIVKGIVSLVPFTLSRHYSPLDSFCDITHGLGFFYGIYSKGKIKAYA